MTRERDEYNRGKKKRGHRKEWEEIIGQEDQR